MPTLEGTSAEGFAKGAYVLAGADEDADVLLIATGSEVQVASRLAKLLAPRTASRRVSISMPCRELFERQDADYRESVLPAAVKARVSVEAGRRSAGAKSWATRAASSASTTSGSPHGEPALKKFGFTAENVVAKAKESVASAR